MEQWRRWDPRIRWSDIIMRMQSPRPNENTLNMRAARTRQSFCMLAWHSRSKSAGDNKARDLVLARLTDEQKAANTTRGITPGLRDPGLGAAGGRISQPPPKPQRSGTRRGIRNKPKGTTLDSEPPFLPSANDIPSKSDVFSHSKTRTASSRFLNENLPAPQARPLFTPTDRPFFESRIPLQITPEQCDETKRKRATCNTELESNERTNSEQRDGMNKSPPTYGFPTLDPLYGRNHPYYILPFSYPQTLAVESQQTEPVHQNDDSRRSEVQGGEFLRNEVFLGYQPGGVIDKKNWWDPNSLVPR